MVAKLTLKQFLAYQAEITRAGQEGAAGQYQVESMGSVTKEVSRGQINSLHNVKFREAYDALASETGKKEFDMKDVLAKMERMARHG